MFELRLVKWNEGGILVLPLWQVSRTLPSGDLGVFIVGLVFSIWLAPSIDYHLSAADGFEFDTHR